MIEIHYVSWTQFLFHLLLREAPFILITLSFLALGGMIESCFFFSLPFFGVLNHKMANLQYQLLISLEVMMALN